MHQGRVDRSIELSKRCKLHRDTSSIKYVHCRGDVTQAAGSREHQAQSRYLVRQRAAGTPTMRHAGVNRSIDSSNAANSIEILNRLSMSMRQGDVIGYVIDSMAGRNDMRASSSIAIHSQSTDSRHADDESKRCQSIDRPTRRTLEAPSRYLID